MYDFLIVGTGLFGAVFAHEASQRGKRCLVLEKRNHIGGNVFCENIDGITVHKYGAHIFHTDNKFIWDYINRFADFNNYIHSPMANFDGKLYNLPVNMNTFNTLWSATTPEEARTVIRKQTTGINDPTKNLEKYAVSLFGVDVYEKLIQACTEKLWDRKCTDLPAYMLEEFPPNFNFDNNYYSGQYQGIPIGGYNQIIEKMLAKCDVKLNTDFFADEPRYRHIADKIIYTGMIDQYFNYCYGELEYRSISKETETLDIPNFQGNAVINYTSPSASYLRIVEHKHFEFGNQEHTVLTYEYPMDYAPGAEAYYPVQDEHNLALFDNYRALAEKERNVIFGGRLATFRHLDMDQAIASAIETARLFAPAEVSV